MAGSKAKSAAERIDRSELARFRLGDTLGEGADMQTFSGTDIETGDAVAIKRPHPSLVSRDMHGDIQRRMFAQAELRTYGRPLPHIPVLHTLTRAESFAWYFGDDLRHPYSVQVESRAKGIPLVGSVSDQVRGHPVGLPMNLFGLHSPHPEERREFGEMTHPALQTLTVIEKCLDRGFLAADLGPRNVFYSPRAGKVTVIDLGSLETPRPAESRRGPLDLNDVLLEFFQSYTSPYPPPEDLRDFEHVRERRLVGTLARRAESLSRDYDSASDICQRRREVAVSILERIGRRGYCAVSDFRADFGCYLDTLYEDAPNQDMWRGALDGLRKPYWRKFLFDPDEDLSR